MVKKRNSSKVLVEDAFLSPTQQFKKTYDRFIHQKFPLRTGMAAISLFTLGTILIHYSTTVGNDDKGRGLSLLILGLIAFIPGSYATFQLYGAYKGWKGYRYDAVPSYDE